MFGCFGFSFARNLDTIGLMFVVYWCCGLVTLNFARLVSWFLRFELVGGLIVYSALIWFTLFGGCFDCCLYVAL